GAFPAAPAGARGVARFQAPAEPIAALGRTNRQRDHVRRLIGPALLQPLVRTGMVLVVDVLRHHLLRRCACSPKTSSPCQLEDQITKLAPVCLPAPLYCPRLCAAHFRLTSSRCQRSIVTGLGSKDRQDGLGRNRLTAASRSRSVGCQRGGPP